MIQPGGQYSQTALKKPGKQRHTPSTNTEGETQGGAASFIAFFSSVSKFRERGITLFSLVLYLLWA